MPEPTGLAVCRHLLPEAEACRRARGLDHVVLLPLAPHCDRPWAGWDRVRAALPRAAAACGRLVAIGAACLPAGDPGADRQPFTVLRASSCFALLTDEPTVEQCVARGCYLVTPGWLRQWRRAVAAWGYDTGTAREHFAEFATTILLLDTGTDADAPARLAEFARFVGREADRRAVPLDAFGDRLARAVQSPS